MKTKIVSAITIISFSLLLSACTGSTATKNTEPPLPIVEKTSQKSTIKNLMGMGKSLMCTYTFEDSESKVQMKGVTYINGNKFAQESESTNPADPAMSIKNYMVSDGDYVYTWSPIQKGTGMKIKIEEPKEEGSQTTKADVAGAKENMEKEYEMDCIKWDADQAKFNIPLDVKFTDYSEMMKNLPKAEDLINAEDLKKMPKVPTMPE